MSLLRGDLAPDPRTLVDILVATAAFSTVNDALGAAPDAELREVVPPEVLEVVTFGRPVEGGER